MAESAGGKRRSAKRRGGGKRKTNAARPGPGHNSGEVAPEIIQRHYAQIGTALKASKPADEVARKKRPALQSASKAAKSDGCPVDATEKDDAEDL